MQANRALFDAVSKSSFLKVADMCDRVLSAPEIQDRIERGMYSRQQLCQYWDIGESTLSGWLREDRIPCSAKEAIVLLDAVQGGRQEVDRLNRAARLPKVIKSGDQWLVCSFTIDEAGLETGQVLATVADEATARAFAQTPETIRLLRAARGVIDDMLYRTENEEYIEQLRELDSTIEAQDLLCSDLQRYRQEYRTKSPDEVKAAFMEAIDETLRGDQ